MGIFSRLSDVINSNIHAMLDKAQDPEKMVRLIIQEMEDTLVEVRSTSVRTLARKKEVHRAAAALKSDAAEWQSKAELAVSREREDLARGALAARNRATEQLATYEKELALLEEEIQKLDQDTARLKAKLDDARIRQKTIAVRQQSLSSRLKVQGNIHDVRIDQAMVKMENYESRIDRMEAEVESFDLGTRNLKMELGELAAQDEFEAELAELRSRVGRQNNPSANRA